MSLIKINNVDHVELVNTFRTSPVAAMCIGQYVWSEFDDSQGYQMILYGVTRTENPFLLLDDKNKLWEQNHIYVPFYYMVKKIRELQDIAVEMGDYIVGLDYEKS